MAYTPWQQPYFSQERARFGKAMQVRQIEDLKEDTQYLYITLPGHVNVRLVKVVSRPYERTGRKGIRQFWIEVEEKIEEWDKLLTYRHCILLANASVVPYPNGLWSCWSFMAWPETDHYLQPADIDPISLAWQWAIKPVPALQAR